MPIQASENWETKDSLHCAALKHEFLRCEEAFKQFEGHATEMILHGENRSISYKTYNAYSDFLHRLYEFLKGATFREIKLQIVKGKITTERKGSVVIKK